VERSERRLQRRREHPDWLKIRANIQSKVRAKEGVPGDLSRVGVNEESSGEDDESDDRAPSSEGVAISPTNTAKVHDEQFEPLSIPQKWLRLELDIHRSYIRYTQTVLRGLMNHETRNDDAGGDPK